MSGTQHVRNIIFLTNIVQLQYTKEYRNLLQPYVKSNMIYEMIDKIGHRIYIEKYVNVMMSTLKYTQYEKLRVVLFGQIWTNIIHMQEVQTYNLRPKLIKNAKYACSMMFLHSIMFIVAIFLDLYRVDRKWKIMLFFYKKTNCHS